MTVDLITAILGYFAIGFALALVAALVLLRGSGALLEEDIYLLASLVGVWPAWVALGALALTAFVTLLLTRLMVWAVRKIVGVAV